MRAADAVIVSDGESDVIVTTQAPAVAVCVTPTAAALPTQLSVTAPDLVLANLVMTVLATGAGTGPWPSDVRLAAPAEPVVGIVTEPDSPAAFDKVTAALSEAGARVVALELEAPVPLNIPDELDAVITLARPTAMNLCAVTVDVDGSALTVLARAFEDAVAFDIAALVTRASAGRCLATRRRRYRRAGGVRRAPARRTTDPSAHRPRRAVGRRDHHGAALPDDRLADDARQTRDHPGARRRPRAPHCTGTRWLMSAAALGRFLAALPAPMQLGKVEFDDGTWRTAFGCDAAAATGTDISEYGSWPAAVAAGAVPGLG